MANLNCTIFSLEIIRILFFMIIVNSCFFCVQKNNKTRERLVEQRMVAVKTQDEILTNSIEIRNDTINYSLKDSLKINYFWQIRASSNIDLCICKDSTIIFLGLGQSPDYVELVCEDIRFLEILFYKMFKEKIRFDKSINLGNRYSLRTPYTCLLYTSPSPRDGLLSRMPSSA